MDHTIYTLEMPPHIRAAQATIDGQNVLFINALYTESSANLRPILGAFGAEMEEVNDPDSNSQMA